MPKSYIKCRCDSHEQYCIGKVWRVVTIGDGQRPMETFSESENMTKKEAEELLNRLNGIYTQPTAIEPDYEAINYMLHKAFGFTTEPSSMSERESILKALHSDPAALAEFSKGLSYESLHAIIQANPQLGAKVTGGDK